MVPIPSLVPRMLAELAIGHREGNTPILDAIRERKPPSSPEAVVEEFANFLKTYRITKVIGDRYGGEFSRGSSFGNAASTVKRPTAASRRSIETCFR